MKTTKVIVLLVLSVTSSCTYQEVQDINKEINSITVSSVDLINGDAYSRVAIDLSNGAPTFPFREIDTLGIFPEKGDQVSFPLTKDAGKTSATFDGGGWALKDGITYYSYIPFNRVNFASDQERNKIPISYIGQKQSTLNSRTEIEPYVYMATEGVCSSNGSLYFMLKHVGALARIGVKIPEAATFSKIYILAESDVFALTGTINLEANDLVITPTSWSDRITLNLNNQKFSASDIGTSFDFWVMMPPADCTGHTLNVVLVDTFGNTYTSVTRENKNKNFLAGYYYGFTTDVFVKENGAADEGGNIGLLMESDNMSENEVNINF